jgi:hypothetical protein
MCWFCVHCSFVKLSRFCYNFVILNIQSTCWKLLFSRCYGCLLGLSKALLKVYAFKVLCLFVRVVERFIKSFCFRGFLFVCWGCQKFCWKQKICFQGVVFVCLGCQKFHWKLLLSIILCVYVLCVKCIQSFLLCEKPCFSFFQAFKIIRISKVLYLSRLSKVFLNIIIHVHCVACSFLHLLLLIALSITYFVVSSFQSTSFVVCSPQPFLHRLHLVIVMDSPNGLVDLQHFDVHDFSPPLQILLIVIMWKVKVKII